MKATPIKRVHFVEYNAKVDTLASGVILPKYGTPLLAAILKERGYAVRIFLEGVSDMSFERLTDCDLVCFPVYSPALNKIKECAGRMRRQRPDLPLVMGGPQVCLYPETVVDLCDYAVRCEADEALPELIECLSRGGDVRGIQGISFRHGGEIVHTPDRPPPAIPGTIPDLTLIEGFERATRGPHRQRVINSLQTSRGCIFHCKFCPTTKLFAGVYRNRDIDSILADIRARLRYNRIFFVVDNSFLSNRKRTIELLHRLIQENFGAFFIIFERHEIGRDTELLQLMWRAGVRCIIVGIESLVDENLDLYDKRQTSRDVIDSVRNILAQNIHVIGTFVLGGDGDTKERAAEIIDFVRATGISLNLFIVHDVEDDESKGLMIPLSRRFQTYYTRTDPHNTDYYDYYTGNFVTYFPKRMKPSTLQECMTRIYRDAFSYPNILRRMWSRSIFNATFGVAHGFALRRLGRTILEPVGDYYLGFLRQIEEGLYDEHEVLREDRLARLEKLPIPQPMGDHVDSRRYKRLISLCVMPGLVRYGLVRLRKKCAALFTRKNAPR